MNNCPVVPIPPDFHSDQSLNTSTTGKYLSYLNDAGIQVVMSTAGTSSFNLLSIEEVHEFNATLAASRLDKKILGIPAVSERSAVEFAKHALSNYLDDSCHLMPLYPDRWYDDNTIISYFRSIRQAVDKPLYVHCMPIRAATGGVWDFSSSLLNSLHNSDIICGIKEEHSSFKQSYDFILGLNKSIDVIVAGGSMRRHQYLRSAGANTFLSGVGNFFPSIENDYCLGKNVDKSLALESKLFSVFMKIGWHKSLREGLRIQGITCKNSRSPWPEATEEEIRSIKSVLSFLEQR